MCHTGHDRIRIIVDGGGIRSKDKPKWTLIVLVVNDIIVLFDDCGASSKK